MARQLFEAAGVERGLRVEQQLAERRAEPGGDLLAFAGVRQPRRRDLVESAIAVVDRAQDGKDLGQRRRSVATGEGELERVEAGGRFGGRLAQWACARR
ncbi:MAG TPA: hypothetical protein VKQ70_05685 [Caulobacteraceae bacterium]|nr:hypothetical protein [Caulobacteraceae bacterium]